MCLHLHRNEITGRLVQDFFIYILLMFCDIQVFQDLNSKDQEETYHISQPDLAHQLPIDDACS